MKCAKKKDVILPFRGEDRREDPGERPEFPDKLTDLLTEAEMPFSNRENIRQRILKFLLEEKGYLKDDISVCKEITFEIDGRVVRSPVDISIILDDKTLMVWKCASGSLVSRQRQVIASARLLEDCLVPFAVVTNGRDLELLDSSTERVLGSGFSAIPSRQGLAEMASGLPSKSVADKRKIYEQRILYTYDAISCCPAR